MLDTLYKKAQGYVIEEVTEEYSLDENGQPKLVKRKVHNKYIPPDMSAIKAYMQHYDDKLTKMSEKELQKEKQKLLQKLIKNQGAQNEKSKS